MKGEAMKKREKQINERLTQMPRQYRKTYQRAAAGSASPRMAIKAFCQECVGWQREEIKNCTGTACPLFLYRPYQSSSSKRTESSREALCASTGDKLSEKAL